MYLMAAVVAVAGGIRFGGNGAAGGGAGGGDRCSKMGEMELVVVVVAAVAEVATMAELEDASAGERKGKEMKSNGRGERGGEKR